jgi:hypothetical protein
MCAVADEWEGEEGNGMEEGEVEVVWGFLDRLVAYTYLPTSLPALSLLLSEPFPCLFVTNRYLIASGE